MSLENRMRPSNQTELSIRNKSVQRIYNFYIKNLFYVNRKYQRKLVWNIEEKRAFIDSILNGFPVPIILLAQTQREDDNVFEIIDGMQRLNSITFVSRLGCFLPRRFSGILTIIPRLKMALAENCNSPWARGARQIP
jgi:hypothetical protein